MEGATTGRSKPTVGRLLLGSQNPADELIRDYQVDVVVPLLARRPTNALPVPSVRFTVDRSSQSGRAWLELLQVMEPQLFLDGRSGRIPFGSFAPHYDALRVLLLNSGLLVAARRSHLRRQPYFSRFELLPLSGGYVPFAEVALYLRQRDIPALQAGLRLLEGAP